MSLDAIGIACENIEKSSQFYMLFGLEFKKFGDDHMEGSTSSGVRIMLDSFKLLQKIDPDWKKPIQPGLTLCFKQSSPKEVDLLVQKIKSNGYQVVKAPWDAFWNQRYASVLDVDGNKVDIFSDL